MRLFTIFLLFISLLISVSAQTRQQAIAELEQLKERGKSLDVIILQIDKPDIDDSSKENVNAFRILPREIYDVGLLATRGGGADYSFSNKSHNYNDTPQIELQQNNLSVGFAGADYGFIADLGEIPLLEINKEAKGANFLINYQPPNQLAKARIEQEKARSFEQDGIIYKDNLPAIVGHSYILRAITFGGADVLVAFKIHRKDTDGSLIIFWKLLEQFEKPMLNRSDETSGKQSDSELQEKILHTLRAKGFHNLTVDVSTKPMTLRGTVPKGKLAKALFTTLEANGGKPIKNEMTEQ